jgi:hypothetical protein
MILQWWECEHNSINLSRTFKKKIEKEEWQVTPGRLQNDEKIMITEENQRIKWEN